MTTLHIITGVNVGGAETMLAKLLEAGGDTARSVVLSMLTPGPVGRRMISRGVRVETLGMHTGIPSPVAFARLVATTSRIRPTLIQGWMYHGNLAATAAARLRPRLPLVWNIRHSVADLANEKPMSRTVIRMGAALSRVPDAIVYNSKVAVGQHAALGYANERSTVIPNGFDCTLFRPSPAAAARLRQVFSIVHGGIIVGMVARRHPMKDAAMLVDAIVRARAAGHDLHLLIVGQDMDQPAADVAAMLGDLPPARVTLVGARSDIADWLPGLDLLAVPSAWGEGFPNILGEAMAGGVPCVATDVGDAAWIIGDTGSIVPPRDPAAMAAALIRMAEIGHERRRALGDRARARILDNFALDSVAARYQALYERLREGAAARPSRGVRLTPATGTVRVQE